MDAKGRVVQPGEGAVWNMSPGRSAALKLQNAETAESVMAFEETAPAGTDTTFHLHYNSDELIYVLSGEFTFKIDDQVTIGGPGTCAFIPRGVAHAWKNAGAEPGRALFLYTPGGAGRMFEEARRLQRPLSSMDDREVGICTMMPIGTNPYNLGLDKNAANFTPRTPIGFLLRSASVYPDRPAGALAARSVGHGDHTWR
jgi:quercetin dioxygenase-like cupin family protein